MTPAEAIAFVAAHGIVLESARREPFATLADAIAGEPIRGHWWAHREGRTIFALTRAVRESADVLVCRLVDGKITFVHRRLWPALARTADRFPPRHLARIDERHTRHGAHEVIETPFPDWLPQDAVTESRRIGEPEARRLLAPLFPEAVTAP